MYTYIDLTGEYGEKPVEIVDLTAASDEEKSDIDVISVSSESTYKLDIDETDLEQEEWTPLLRPPVLQRQLTSQTLHQGFIVSPGITTPRTTGNSLRNWFETEAVEESSLGESWHPQEPDICRDASLLTSLRAGSAPRRRSQSFFWTPGSMWSDSSQLGELRSPIARRMGTGNSSERWSPIRALDLTSRQESNSCKSPDH